MRVARRSAKRLPMTGPSVPTAPSTRCLTVGAMLVSYTTQIDVSFEVATRAILAKPEQWLPWIATATEERERQLLAEVGFEVAHVRVEKQVEIELVDLVRSPSKVVLLIRWKAHRATGLFPVLEGSLEVTPSSDGSQLFVNGEYQPPGGAVGRVTDRAVLHRIAKATVRDFAERIAATLPELSGEAADGPGDMSEPQ
jgi:hypothetical protein